MGTSTQANNSVKDLLRDNLLWKKFHKVLYLLQNAHQKPETYQMYKLILDSNQTRAVRKLVYLMEKFIKIYKTTRHKTHEMSMMHSKIRVKIRLKLVDWTSYTSEASS